MSGFNLDGTITYWLPSHSDGYNRGWAAPVTISARIAFVTEVVFTPEGKNTHSTNAIYTRTYIPLGGFIVEGTEASLVPVSSARLVLAASKIPSMSDLSRMLI